jgi:hypothetical protein
MQIIKPGMNQKPEVMRFDCGNCGCIFIAEGEEFIKLETNDKTVAVYQCECPNCQKRIWTGDRN